MAIITYTPNVNFIAMSGEANGLTNNSLVLSSFAFSGMNYVLAQVEYSGWFAVAPTANTGPSLWFLLSNNGVNFEDGSASVTPAKLPDVVFPLRAVTTNQIITRITEIPQGIFKSLLKNDGTGQTMGSGVISILPFTYQNN